MDKINPSFRPHFNDEHKVEKKKKAKGPVEKKTAKATANTLAHVRRQGGKPLMKRVSKNPKGDFVSVAKFARVRLSSYRLANRVSVMVENKAMAKLAKAAFANKPKAKTTKHTATLMKPSARAMRFAKALAR